MLGEGRLCSLANKDYGKSGPTATEGVHDAMGKVIGINSGIVGAAGTAGAIQAAPGAALAAMQSPEKLASGSKAATDFVSGAFEPGPPPPTWPGYIGSRARYEYEEYKKRQK